MKRWRRSALAVTSVACLVTLAPSGSSAQTLPSQAPAVANEHTHGPDGLDLDRRGRPVVAGEPYAVDATASWKADQYDGVVKAADSPDLNSHAQFHAIYVYPSDKSSRFADYAAMFQADARDASALLETLYGRAIRFDDRPSETVVGQSVLDITVFKSKYNSKQLATTRQFNLVNDELAAKFNQPGKKYMAWLDAGSQYCGQGNLSQDTKRNGGNQNEGRTLAIVYRPYNMADTATGGFCRGRTLRHELGHTMGALQSVAPHAYDGAHCNDSAEDTMCYVSATSTDTGVAAFDFRNDDYWDPRANSEYISTFGPYLTMDGKLPWWTVNLSAFLCDAPTACGRAAIPQY